MTKPKHTQEATARPWEWTGVSIIAGDGTYVLDKYTLIAPENARLICAAVNLHEGLVKELREAVRILKDRFRDTGELDTDISLMVDAIRKADSRPA